MRFLSNKVGCELAVILTYVGHGSKLWTRESREWVEVYIIYGMPKNIEHKLR